jgi:hypothetical protein
LRRSGYFETLISKRLLTTEGAEDSQRPQNKDGWVLILLSVWILFLAATQRRSGYFETLISKRLLTTEGAEDSQRPQNKDGLGNITTVYLEFIS